jgi:hypothetical protein
MLTCPMCKKSLPDMEKVCKTCQTDVSLLVDYVENLQEGIDLAERLTREGQLGEAVWAYLAVLEVDPDNAVARRQVGRVATAVRQFDKTAPGRRWLSKHLHKRNRFRRWVTRLREMVLEGEGGEWLSQLFWFVLILGVFLAGCAVGYYSARASGPVEMPHVEDTQRTTPAEQVSVLGSKAENRR